MTTDVNTVDVANGYADNFPPIQVAASNIGGRRYQRVLLYDSNGNPVLTTNTETYLNPEKKAGLSLPVGYYLFSALITTTGSTTTTINLTSTPAAGTLLAGDLIHIASGTAATGLSGEAVVSGQNGNQILLDYPVPIAPGSGQVVYIYRRHALVVDSAGSLQVGLSGVGTVFAKLFGEDKPAFKGYSIDAATVAGGGGTFVYAFSMGEDWFGATITNLMDADLSISFDAGTTDSLIVTKYAAGASPHTINFIQYGQKFQANDIYVRYVSAVAPATGDLWICGQFNE